MYGARNSRDASAFSRVLALLHSTFDRSCSPILDVSRRSDDEEKQDEQARYGGRSSGEEVGKAGS